MQVIENKKIDEKVYIETLENGMKIIIIPKDNTKKKYIIWGTKFGSNDNHFIEPKTGKEIQVPDGVAHYLEHKMFEQESGVDSLYTLMALGLDANAYTTNDHTAYLFACTDNFYEGLDELMDYVQSPYFTDENVNKERGIIEQEIQRYDDEPIWKLYINAMNCLYKNNPITIDVAGTVESISHITKETLYSCYNTFYHPSNMIMCISGDFEPNTIVEEIKKRLKPREKMAEIKRIYPEYEPTINKNYIEKHMNVNMPLFMIGYRDFLQNENQIKKDIAIRIVFNSILGKCSKTYQDLYNSGLLMREMDCDFEFSNQYSHVLISGESRKPEEVYNTIIDKLQNEEISIEDFERSKKRIYGEFVTNYDDVEHVGRMFLADSIRGINSLDYIDEISNMNIEYVNKIRKEMLKKDEAILSIVK
ncbi:MAG: insulinase family protein [Clostridia bacterium]|nr:insulinase family protein [Clostridia bacterium]